MMVSQDQASMAQQYSTAANLHARAALHQRFSVNTHGWIPWVFDQLDLPDECRILEVGCGTGGLWQANRQRISAGWRLVLTDASDGMAETTRKHLGDLPQVESIARVDAQALPYNNAVFDVVIANHMLYHVSDLNATLKEIRRVLKPRGILYATTIGERNLQEFWELLLPFVLNVTERLDQRDITDRFSLESGVLRLAQLFAVVQTRRYEDALAVTEVEPLVAYAQSLTTSGGPVLAGERLEQFRALVAEEISTHGAFHITKDSGMHIAQKVADA